MPAYPRGEGMTLQEAEDVATALLELVRKVRA
jgi:hypothetical protein